MITKETCTSILDAYRAIEENEKLLAMVQNERARSELNGTGQ